MRAHHRIDPRRLRILLQLQRCGTIAATARALALTTSAVSQQLSTLADEVGTRLLVRHGRLVKLTPQAQILIKHAQAIDGELERALVNLAAHEAGALGQVTIGAFSTAIVGLVAPALDRLRRDRAGLEVLVHEVDPAECYFGLDRGDLDLAVTVDYRRDPPQLDGRYWRRELLRDPFLVALPRRHPLAAGRSVDLRELARERWILEEGNGPCQDAILGACVAAGFTPAIRHRVNDWLSVLHLVAAGCGVGIVPRLAVAGAPAAAAALRAPLPAQRFCRNLYAVARSGAERAPSVQAVLDALGLAARDARERS